MAQILVSTKNMDREEWLEWRKKGIGGSDASIVCGLRRYKSPVELWMEKTSQIKPKEVTSEAAYWGTLLEPLIRLEFVKRTGLQIKHQQVMFQHPQHPFMLANLDGFVNDPVHGKCVFEAKTTNAYRAEEWNERVPEDYQLQVQHYMEVTQTPGAYVAALIGGNQFKWYFIERDNDLISMLIELEKRFWHHVEAMTPPPLDGSNASTELLSKLYTQANKQQIILPDNALPLITQYEMASADEKAAEESKNHAINQLKTLLGENESGTLGDRIITWKSISSERLDTKALKSNLPDIYGKYLSTSSYRRFSIR